MTHGPTAEERAEILGLNSPTAGVVRIVDGHAEVVQDLNGLDDVEAILAVTRPDEPSHSVTAEHTTVFNWEYELTRAPLERLYEKAKRSQWNATTDIPWDTDVDPEKLAQLSLDATPFDRSMWHGSPVESWGDAEWLQFEQLSQRWMLSQFLHGEQGALVCTAKITETVPWYQAKLYASTQVMDEARHVEVFQKYIDDKLGGRININAHLGALLDDIVADSRWDVTYLGMQILVEGLALSAFGFMRALTPDPLLRTILEYVMSDEARHVAFGTLSLAEVYTDMTQAELRERQEFAFEASVRMRDRFLQQEVWELMGVSPKEILPFVLQTRRVDGFQNLLFSKIVPNCRKLGLLDANDAWLRERFTELGVIQHEHADSTDDEVSAGVFDLQLA